MVGGTCLLDAGGTLRLHIFLDGSIVEIFANDRACLTTRIYPSQPDSGGIELFARGGEVHLSRFDCWTMASIWD